MSHVYFTTPAKREKPKAAMPGDFGETKETITVYEPATDTVDTGLLDASGQAIHKRLIRPIGFVRFD